MSTRRFRQSSKHGAPPPYVIDMNEPVSHWSRQWVSPNLPRQQPQAPQLPMLPPSIAPSANGTPHEGTDTPKDGSSIFQFQVKTWVQIDDEEYEPVEDGDYEDALDLQSSTAGRRQQKEEPSQGGLTAADIRGAVGGEAIPGIVAEYKGDDDGDAVKENGKDKEPEKVQEKENDTDVVMTEQTPEIAPQPTVLPVAEIINPTVVAESNEQAQAAEEKDKDQGEAPQSLEPTILESTAEIVAETTKEDTPKPEEPVAEPAASEPAQGDNIETAITPAVVTEPESEPVVQASAEEPTAETSALLESNVDQKTDDKKDEQGDVAMEEAPES